MDDSLTEFLADNVTDLHVTGEQRGSFGFGHHSDLLEGQQVMDVDVVLWTRELEFTIYLSGEWSVMK